MRTAFSFSGSTGSVVCRGSTVFCASVMISYFLFKGYTAAGLHIGRLGEAIEISRTDIGTQVHAARVEIQGDELAANLGRLPEVYIDAEDIPQPDCDVLQIGVRDHAGVLHKRTAYAVPVNWSNLHFHFVSSIRGQGYNASSTLVSLQQHQMRSKRRIVNPECDAAMVER